MAYQLDMINGTIPAAPVQPSFGYYHDERQVLVYDLGANTLDVTIITIEEGVFEVQSTASNAYLGGETFNRRLVEYIAGKYIKNYNFDVTGDATIMGKLRQDVEEAKRLLSSQDSTTIKIRPDPDQDEYLLESLTRADFEALNNDLFEKTLEYVERVLKNASLTRNDINEVVLAGGSSRIPKIQLMLEDFFGRAVSKEINPEEVIAIGAAVQASIMAEDHLNVGYMFVNRLLLGIEDTNGVMVPLVKRGTTLPIMKSGIFSTTHDNQSTFPVRIFEGERVMASDNHMLAEFQLENIS